MRQNPRFYRGIEEAESRRQIVRHGNKPTEAIGPIQGLLNVCDDIIACYRDVLGTESEPNWIEDLREAVKSARENTGLEVAREKPRGLS
jgi:hypothetical protein